MDDNRTLFERLQKIISQKVGEEKEHIYYTGNIVIDLPRKKGRYHGSSFVIQPAHCYNIEGDAITSTDITNKVIRELKDANCKVTDVHEYLEEMNIMREKEKMEDQTHIHFKCDHKSDDDILKILQFLPELK